LWADAAMVMVRRCRSSVGVIRSFASRIVFETDRRMLKKLSHSSVRHPSLQPHRAPALARLGSVFETDRRGKKCIPFVCPSSIQLHHRIVGRYLFRFPPFQPLILFMAGTLLTYVIASYRWKKMFLEHHTNST
jgi:hypothetical protein